MSSAVLREGEVHIYFLGIPDAAAAACGEAAPGGRGVAAGVAHQERWRAMLSPEERARHDRFVFERDRHRFLASHAWIRLVLSAYTGIGPADLKFEANRFGKPFLRPAQGICRPYFSLSHTTKLAACAIAFEPEVGIDVEDTGRAADWELLARSSFSPSEQALLMRAPAEVRQSRFYDLWTLKEAYIKARGMGLSLPLQQFSMRLPDNAPTENAPIGIAFSAPLADLAESWQFALTTVGACRMALAIRKTNSPDWEIRHHPLSSVFGWSSPP